MRPRPLIYSCALALLMTTADARALTGDSAQAIEIEAETMVLDQENGVSTYTGGVTLTQGSIRIEAARLVVYVRNRKLDRLEAFGANAQPASFRQRLTDGGETRAHAGHLEYHTREARLILRQQAELRQGGSHIRSERIDYNTASNSLVAGQQDAGQRRERVRIVIDAGQNDSGEAEQTQ